VLAVPFAPDPPPSDAVPYTLLPEDDKYTLFNYTYNGINSLTHILNPLNILVYDNGEPFISTNLIS
jgi:hypothetical protein